MKTPSYRVQAITDSDKSWPYVGNAYRNKDGSVSLLLDRGVKIELADGTRLEADGKQRVKLFLRVPRAKAEPTASDASDMPPALMTL